MGIALSHQRQAIKPDAKRLKINLFSGKNGTHTYLYDPMTLSLLIPSIHFPYQAGNRPLTLIYFPLN